jgi:hypothetical protein
MLFTSAPLTRSQATSHQSHWCEWWSSLCCDDSRISIISTQSYPAPPTPLFNTAAFLLRVKVGFGARTNVLLTSVTTTLFRNPPLVVTFTGKMDETRSSMMQSLGFPKQSQNSAATLRAQHPMRL